MMCPQRLARMVRSKQLFVHVGAHIIAPITAAALAFVSPTNTSIKTLAIDSALCFANRLVPGIVLRSTFFSKLRVLDEHKGHSTE